RTRERRDAQARRRGGRRAAAIGPAGRYLSRSGVVVVAEGGLGRALGLDRAPRPLMSEMPRPARIYVGAVITAGIALMLWRLPDVRPAQPALFVALLVLSSVSAALKVALPLTTSGSTMSVSYAVDFASLLLLGPHETMLVAAGSAYSQCQFNSKDRNPLYLTYRTYKVYMGRIEDEQRHVQQTSDLHLATIEALARAIDAKDQTTQMHIRRVQVYAAGLARMAGLSEAEIQGVKTAALLH